MPTAPRPMRSLLALALVANLVAISAPTAALALQRSVEERAPVAPAVWLPVAADAADRVEAALAAEAVSAPARPVFPPLPPRSTARPPHPVPTPEATAGRPDRRVP